MQANAAPKRGTLHMEGRPAGMLPINVVVCTQEDPGSLLADSIGDVVEVRDETFEDPPQTLEANMRSLITGVYKLDGRLMLVLNTERACESLERT